MKKESFREVKKELVFIGILFIIFLMIFKALFYKESFSIVARTVFSIFWMLVVPGYFLMCYWNEKLGFTERIIAGVVLSAAIIGIFSYYLGIMGLNIKYHGLVLPSVLIISGILINWKKQVSSL